MTASIWDSKSPPRATVARLPARDALFAEVPFESGVFARVDRAIAEAEVADGRLEIATPAVRLICLIRAAGPYLAGLAEAEAWRRLPLRDLSVRAEQLEGARCALVRTDDTLNRMAAAHLCGEPVLRSSTRLVDPAHALQALAEEGRDAVLALERSGRRALLFLRAGSPERVYFADPEDDPGEGDAADRLLLFAFSPSAPPGRLEVFTDLTVEPDADAGTPLAELAASSKPAPPVNVAVSMGDGRQILYRPFTPPELLIGRDPRCEVYLDNLAVSRRHARIAWRRGRFEIEDLGSANGTRLEGTQVRTAELKVGDRVEIGKFRIVLEEHLSASGMTETMFLSTRRPSPELYLEGEGTSTSLDHGAVIGRGEGVDVLARGLFVRPVHARIVRLGRGELEVQCFGRARVSVNGRRTRSAGLLPGDRIGVGGSVFQVVKRSPRPGGVFPPERVAGGRGGHPKRG